MANRPHPHIHPSHGGYSSYINIDPLYLGRMQIQGFDLNRDDNQLRYTPITVSQEELVYHKNINYAERGLKFPRFLDQMFDSDFYTEYFEGMPPPAPFKLKFIEDPNAKIKVFIGITMYQEPCGGLDDVRRPGLTFIQQNPDNDRPEAFKEQAMESGGVPGTLVGVLENVRKFVAETQYKWEEICVCLLADGRTRINGAYNNLQALQRMGMYLDLEEMYREEGLMDISGRIQPIDRYNFDRIPDKSASRDHPRFTVDNGQPVYVHLFENVIHYENYPPLQMMFALKEFNAGKLDTHLWFFEGFAHHFYRTTNERAEETVHEELYCVCLDAGTRPYSNAIVKLIDAMDASDKVAGCCGEITVDRNLHPINIFYNWYVASQNFEYKVGNCFDKACESSFGFISVLPGAFSAYRWSALSPPELGPTSAKRPIVPYFKSVTHGGVVNPFLGNMYLAEDRILALELVCSRTAANVLRYVKGSVAVTDVPDTCAALIKQRRRWLNGSFFAQLFSLWQGLFQFRIFTTRHNVIRKLALMIELIYYIFNTIMTWFLVGVFYLTFLILWDDFLVNDGDHLFEGADIVFVVIKFIYLLLMFCIFLLAMGTAPDAPRRSLRVLYVLISLLFGVFMMGTFALAVYNVIESDDTVLAAVGIAAVASYVIVAFLHCEGHHILLTYFQYSFMAPTYINVFQVFAFCNTHDLSWGTKGLDNNDVSQKDVQAQRNEFRTYLVLFWALCNLGLIFAVAGTTLDGGAQTVSADTFLLVVLGIVVAFNGFKTIGSVWFLFGHYVRKCFRCICGGRGKSRAAKKTKKKQPLTLPTDPRPTVVSSSPPRQVSV
ncbi:Chitin synthase, class 2 [Perkinsus olseni]|uniref:chitin synthase n=1 Tax=Perkinsus olseni TaxID=32597 RepID=A0A7J6U3U6_PEROL|nr:Chitin synthase, class 2 [Perkinsus olseni]KAF4751497.1 Chitin synthase, class 2 [Perkinsus olseni]